MVLFTGLVPISNNNKYEVASLAMLELSPNLTWIKRFLQALNVQAYGLARGNKEK